LFSVPSPPHLALFRGSTFLSSHSFSSLDSTFIHSYTTLNFAFLQHTPHIQTNIHTHIHI
jgi:hypothetical protein